MIQANNLVHARPGGATNEENHAEISALKAKVKELQAEADTLRSKLLKYQLAEINDLQQRIQPIMKIAI